MLYTLCFGINASPARKLDSETSRLIDKFHNLCVGYSVREACAKLWCYIRNIVNVDVMHGNLAQHMDNVIARYNANRENVLLADKLYNILYEHWDLDPSIRNI